MSSIDRLLEIMARLRDPQRGCPWDLEQTFATIAPYTIEEAYEVADAIERNDSAALRDELGDLLFQVVFHSQMAREQGSFAFDDVVAAICDKLERRHPHVFGDARRSTARRRRPSRGKSRSGGARAAPAASVLADVPLALPALTRANKLGKRAAQVGFEWPERARVRSTSSTRSSASCARSSASRRGPGGDHRRARRRAVLRRQRLPLPRRRSGSGVAWRKHEIRAPLRLRRAAAARAGPQRRAKRRWRKWIGSGTRGRSGWPDRG